jgi:hypothetical protein
LYDLYEISHDLFAVKFRIQRRITVYSMGTTATTHRSFHSVPAAASLQEYAEAGYDPEDCKMLLVRAFAPEFWCSQYIYL